MGLPTLAPLQVTRTVPVPRRVLPPMSHVQLTLPLASAFLGTRLAASLTFPSGVTYEIEQYAPGVVWTATLALPPGAAPITARNWGVC